MMRIRHIFGLEPKLPDNIPMFTFGKYRNRLFSEVLEEDPGYIKWAYETVDDRAGIPKPTYTAACKRVPQRKQSKQWLIGDWGDEEFYEDFPEADRMWGDL